MFSGFPTRSDRHKPGCAAIEDGLKLEISVVFTYTISRFSHDVAQIIRIRNLLCFGKCRLDIFISAMYLKNHLFFICLGKNDTFSCLVFAPACHSSKFDKCFVSFVCRDHSIKEYWYA